METLGPNSLQPISKPAHKRHKGCIIPVVKKIAVDV